METELSKSQRRTSIRTKLLVGLAVPVLFVALISGFQVNKAQKNLTQTRGEVSLALAAGGPTTYITALMDERNITALELLNLQGAVTLDRVKNSGQARKATDETQAEFEKSLDTGGSEVRQLFGPTFDEARSRLAAIRDESDAIPQEQRNTGNQAAEGIYDAYSALIGQFHTANANAVRRIDDAQLRNRADSIAAQTKSSDVLSLMSRTAALSFIQDITISEQLLTQERFTEFQAAKNQAIDDLARDPAAQKVMRGFYARPTMKRFEDAIRLFARTGQVEDVPRLIADAADVKYPNGTDAWQAARSSLQDRGATLVAEAQTSRNRYVAVFVLATLISLILALGIARSIARPLLSIADQADDMARNRLPAAVGSILATPIGQDVVEPRLAPITVRSSDEVADVAASINVVQQRALDLAVEQAVQRRNFADTFLNLGRRVQGLVARQLDFITELEDAETDAETLADLFKLDHLATRIRRNAESLVVLAGVTRRQRRGDPVPVIDALRSALGEVDEYPRVDIGRVEPARLPMSVAADLAHILAELIENGLNFSPPDTNVEIDGGHTADGYRITVVDHGIGMTEGQVETANRRLSGNESFTVAPSRYMGHYVAGHLATGLGIDVQLDSSQDGTVATVIVPDDLLAHATGDPDQGVDQEVTATDPLAAALSDDHRTPGKVPVAGATSVQGTFHPPGPPAAPMPEGRAESLSSLLSVHRRLSQPGSTADPDRSPWAARQDATRAGDAPLEDGVEADAGAGDLDAGAEDAPA